MNAWTSAPPLPACPVCGRPVDDPPPSTCPNCGLPAVGQAAHVVARIGVTIRELVADRDALVATLRAAAPGVAPRPAPVPPPVRPEPSVQPVPPRFPPPVFPSPRPPARREPRLSPQQVLLGLGALLVVAAAIAFVAVAWTRLGVGFQAAVMSVVTAVACAASAWTARRGLRATEEALAAAGVALLAVDLAAARALGLFSLEEVPVRLWTAACCAVVLAAGLALGRLTRSTWTWPLAALVAAQPLPFLLLPVDTLTGPAGVAAALVLAGADLLVAVRLRRPLRAVALVLAGAQAAVGTAGGLLVAGSSDAGDSWTATALLVAAAVAAVVLSAPAKALLPRQDVVTCTAAAVCGLAVGLSLRTLGADGPVVGAGLGLALVTAAVLLAAHRLPQIAAWTGGATVAAVGAGLLLEDERWAALAALALAAVVPSVLAAVRRPDLRYPATGIAVLSTASAVLLAHAGGVLPATTAGLLLALVAAGGFAVAALRSGEPEERVAAATAALAGLSAAAVTGTVGAWGQVALQLTVAGGAAGAYAVVSGRRPVAALAVADLVVAAWIALSGAEITTPEAYTLPAAAGLFLLAIPGLRAGARSWATEGAAAAIALAPSAMLVVAEPTGLRLVLVVAAAALMTVAGTLTHRQAPFVVGATSLAFVVVGRVGPYATLAPRWVTLAAAGLLLLVVGASYERRRQQAREAVAWVTQMR